MITHFQTDTLDQMLDRVSQLYTLHNRPAIAAFLRNHPFLAEVVIEAADVLIEVFGQRMPLSLELTHDPEADNPELFAYVHVDLPIEEALRKLHSFDERWFLDQQDWVGGLFNVDVRLI